MNIQIRLLDHMHNFSMVHEKVMKMWVNSIHYFVEVISKMIWLHGFQPCGFSYKLGVQVLVQSWLRSCHSTQW